MDTARRSRRGPLCFYTALCFTCWGLFANNITLASGDYRAVVLSAIACSIAAVLLIGIGWLRMSVTLRVLSFAIALAACWTLVDAGGRRLPAILGWYGS